MEIKYTNEYSKHGCSIKGNLAVVEYWQESQAHAQTLPLAGFGSMCFLDYLDKAKALVREKHPNAVVKLGVPDLVCEI